MKIAYIGTAHPFRGGLASFNHRLAQELQQQHEVTIYSFKLQYPSILFPGKTQYTQEVAPPTLRILSSINSINPWNWLKVGWQIRRERYDIIVIKFWIPFMAPCFGTILRVAKNKNKTKVVTIIDNIIPHEQRWGDSFLTKYFIKAVDAFVVMSSQVAQELMLFDKTKPRQIVPHPIFDNFGTVEPKMKAAKHLRLDTSFRYILFFGFIRPYKGLDLLIEAFADNRFRNQNLKLIIAGEYYSDKKVYQDLIDKWQLQSEIIQINDFITDSEVQHYFNVSDLVVLPYKNATQSGVTQIAYHFNKPMVVTNVGGLKENCPGGKVGYVVEPEPTQIADAIEKFFSHADPVSFEKNIIEIKKKFGWDRLGQAVLNVHAELK